MHLIFIFGIIWSAAWHKSRRIVERAIRRGTWQEVTRETIGVVITYPVIEALFLRSLPRELQPWKRVFRAMLLGSYFGGFVATGIGKIIGVATDG